MTWKISGADGYEERALVGFDGLSLPQGSTVEAAELTLTFDNWRTAFSVNGSYLAASWNAASVGWLNRDGSATWSSPGGAGDVVGGKSFTISGFSGSGTEIKVVALDPGVVQSWVDSPSANDGVLLVNSASDQVTRNLSSSDGTVSRRPKLKITYRSGDAGSCRPVSGGAPFDNHAMPKQTGNFTATFDATPTGVLDGVVGFASGAPAGFSGLAAVARFNASGAIDALDGGSYAGGIPYQANTTYHFRLAVDVASHSYSVFVTAPGGVEQTVGSGYAFRPAQANVTALDDWTVAVDSATGTLNVCNFAIGGSGGDSTAPTVALKAPAAGATLAGTVTLSATASDNVGVAGVQFLVDGIGVGAEATSAPYTLGFDTTTLTNGSHAFSARARDAAGNVATSAAVTADVDNGGTVPPDGKHPRIFLDSASLAALRARAKSGDAQWTALRNACNGYLSGTVQYPDGNDYPNLPNIGEGYQGSDYFDPLMNIGLRYQIGVGINDPNAAQWGQKGADILEKMSNPSHSPPFSRDSGYGIRFFGEGMALGYDWLHGALSSSLKTQVYQQLNGWLSWFDANGFAHDHPQGNYFAGYYAAKAYAGIATEGDNPSGTTIWNDFSNRLDLGGAKAVGSHTGVQAYYSKYMAGGGWTEGWGYGALASVNMALPSLAAKTAKALDLIANATAPYRYPLDNGLHLIEFTWPSLTSLDDRDTMHSGPDIPGAPSSYTTTVTAALLARWNQALAPQFHAYARAIRARGQGGAVVRLPLLERQRRRAALHHPAAVVSVVGHERGRDALRLGRGRHLGLVPRDAFVDYDGSSEEGFDAGSLAIVRGGTPGW